MCRIWVVVALLACSAPKRHMDASVSDDLSVPNDLAVTRDLQTPDLQMPDLQMPDLSTPGGDTCTNAIALSSGVSMNGDTSLLTNDYSFANPSGECPGIGAGSPEYPNKDAVFSITIPAGKTLTATVTATGGAWDAAIFIVSSCSQPPSCLAAMDDDDTAPETASYTNSSGNDMPVYIIVDGYVAAGQPEEGPFSVIATITP